MTRSARLAQAMDLLEQLEGGAPAKVEANLDAFSPDAAELVLGYAFTDIVSRKGIDLRTRPRAAARCSAGAALQLPQTGRSCLVRRE